MTTILKRVATATLVLGLMGTAAAGPAMAAAASRTGSATNSTSSSVSNKDTAPDGNWTSGPWMKKSGAEGSVINRSGHNATVKKSISGVIAVKACVSRPAPLGMACTTWKG